VPRAKWKILVSAPYMQPVIERYQNVFNEHNAEIVLPPVDERLEEDALLQLVVDIDGAVCGDDSFTARIIDAATRLKVISKWGTGIDSIDLDACAKRGIAVRNTPNAFSEAVADTVLGYMLCFARGLLDMDREIRRGNWLKVKGRALHECSLGVIGIGNVGKVVIRRAKSFGMRILGNDVVEIPQDFVSETNLEVVDKCRLLGEADFVSVNCTLNPTSYHLIAEQEFDLMKSCAVLINAARGPIVDESALIRALREKKIGGAALDVYEKEPLPSDSPLLKMDNVLLGSHSANSSRAAWEKVHISTLDNLFEELVNSE